VIVLHLGFLGVDLTCGFMRLLSKYRFYSCVSPKNLCNCSPWKSGCDLDTNATYARIAWKRVLLLVQVYTHATAYAAHVLRGSTLCGLRKNIHKRSHLRGFVHFCNCHFGVWCLACNKSSWAKVCMWVRKRWDDVHDVCPCVWCDSLRWNDKKRDSWSLTGWPPVTILNNVYTFVVSGCPRCGRATHHGRKTAQWPFNQFNYIKTN